MAISTVIIADDHPIICASISLLLQKDPDIKVVLEANNGRNVINYLLEHDVDLVIIDIELPDMDGFEVFRRVKSLKNNIKTLFLSSKPESVYAFKAIQSGSNGFISKEKELSEIFSAAKLILSGYTFFPTNLITASSSFDQNQQKLHLSLTTREITILRHLVTGKSNKEISIVMNLSNKTISTHKANIFSKLSINSIIELADYAKNNNII